MELIAPLLDAIMSAFARSTERAVALCDNLIRHHPIGSIFHDPVMMVIIGLALIVLVFGRIRAQRRRAEDTRQAWVRGKTYR